MKKQLLIGTALLVVIGAFSQTNRERPSGMINNKILLESSYFCKEGTPESIKSATPFIRKQKSKASKTSSTNTWQSFTSSMNIYGSSNSYVKPLQWNDELDAVSFIHRKSPTYISSPAANANAESGTIVAMISKDCGLTWDSTAMWVNNTFWGRFPGGAIYNPPMTPVNTDINNTYMVGSGPTTGASATNFTGSWYSSKKIGAGMYNNNLSPDLNAQQLAPTAGPNLPNAGRHDFATYGFSATDDGKMRVMAGISDDALSPAQDSALMLITGTFNAGIFDWAGKYFSVPTTVASDGSHNFVSRPLMAWNELGTVGYIAVMGSKLGAAGSNVGYQPIVYKTTNGGSTWSLENGIDFNGNAFNDVKRPLEGVATNASLVVPNFYFGEGMDCAVDANNKLHIFTSIISHPSNHPDSLNFINQYGIEKYLWAHAEGQKPYLYDFIYDGTSATPSWSHITIDTMSSEGPGALTTSAGYQDNPWDIDPSQANRKFSIDARLQMSRTPDGQYLLYTWTESDIAFTDNQKHWNNLPNIKARIMDVQADYLLRYKINLTVGAQGEVANRAMCHFVSPKFKFVSKTDERITIRVPVTVSTSGPYTQLSTNTHWYSCATLEFLRPMSADPYNYVGIDENNSTNSNTGYVYPNPARDQVTVEVNLSAISKVQVDVVNTLGQVIKSELTQGQTGTNKINVDISGLPGGIYFVNVKLDHASSSRKLVIE